MAADGWRHEFEPPIVTSDGATLRTLRDAIKHLAATVPKAEHNMPAVMTASELLTRAAAGSPAWLFFARIATLPTGLMFRNWNTTPESSH